MTLLEEIAEARGKRLLIGGHRGNQSGVRENTIPNFEQVLGCGISHIEIDVQLTKDGQAVIYHDLTLKEKSPLSGMIKDYTLEELKQAFEIETLDEALAWCKAHHQGVLLEIKSRELDMHDTMFLLAERIVSALRRYDFFDMCIPFGTDHRTLHRIKELEPRTKIALIVPHVPYNPAGLMRDMDAMIYLCFLENLSKPLIDELHQAGYLVDGSVVNTKERLRLALELGVDMIESDYPKKILAAYAELMEEEKHA